ncbi:MAG: hypothetical protein HOV68_15970 [Streptomycetaceae bacterium]|nr:hypothetical protein [Streptomycetaceae bacterium]
MQIRNSGTTVEEYRFEVVGPCAAWTTVEPERVSLYPETAETVTVRLRPPRESGIPAGESPYGIRVVPTNDPDQAVVPEGSVTVLPFTEVTAELLPRSSHAARKGKHRIAVDNRGNTPVTAKMIAQPGSRRLVPEFGKGEFPIPPGRAEFTEVSMRPAKLIWFGPPQTHSFQIAVATSVGAPPAAPGTKEVAKPGGAPPAEAPTAPAGASPETPPAPEAAPPPAPVLLDGTFEQRAMMPSWVPRAAIALVLIAAVLVGLWFSVLRPTVRSAARDAVPAAVQKIEESKSPSPSPNPSDIIGGPSNTGGAPPGPGGGPGGGQSQSSPGSTNQSPGGPGNGPGGPQNPAASPRPTSARLEVSDGAGGSSSSAAYEVPAGQTLELTDLVVQNPQGDAGTLVIANQDKPILSLALENFRDQDYHFVTPVVVPANASLTMTVNCAQVGRPVAAPAPSGCVQSLLLGGVLRPTGP